jgi:Stage II sporulation protein M
VASTVSRPDSTSRPQASITRRMDASAYALVHGVRGTRATLDDWNQRPWRVLGVWTAGSLTAAIGLLAAVWVIASKSPVEGWALLGRPPFRVGERPDVLNILGRNSLVLALHAMACVAGFIAGSSLPIQARERRGVARVLHERGGRLAIVFVIAATIFSLSAQAYVLGRSVARVAFALHTSPAILLIGLLPHAVPELMALFLPLAAWILASRREQWDQLLAATFVTVLFALPVLIISALWEVFIAPHVLHLLIGY